jgi:predicted metal-dependent phosphoesterase TrpH
MAVFADLHVHTTNSDGRLTLQDIPRAAKAANLGAVAITDHDRVHPDLDAPVVILDDLTVVHGIELRVDAGDQTVDLLGYAVNPTSALESELDRLQANRIERGRAIIEQVEDRLGVELDVEPREGLGRPHVAHAIGDHPDTEYDFQGAFEHLIGAGQPCYVARDIPDFETGVELLSESCGLIGLAHPYRYRDVEAALALTTDLDAVELHYPYGRAVDPRPIERAIDDHDLLATGGSDAHDDRLGRAGLSKDEYLQFRASCRPPVMG